MHVYIYIPVVTKLQSSTPVESASAVNRLWHVGYSERKLIFDHIVKVKLTWNMSR